MEKEIWLDMPEYEGIFAVSNLGKVKSYPRGGTRGGILKGWTNKLGYTRLILSLNNTKKYIFIHRLVASVFIPNPLNLPYVNHKDENSSHNWADNLEWCDAKYNTNYGDGIKRRSLSRYKKVYQFDKNHNLIKAWRSGTEINQETGFLHSKISEVANGKRKSAYGFSWSYTQK